MRAKRIINVKHVVNHLELIQLYKHIKEPYTWERKDTNVKNAIKNLHKEDLLIFILELFIIWRKIKNVTFVRNGFHKTVVC